MSLTLFGNASATRPNLTVPFAAAGGTPPYVYSVSPSAGGTINSSSGLYKAGTRTGIDTLYVQDAALMLAATQITVGSPIELVCDILQSELSLPEGHVYLWNQKIAPRTHSGLYIAVGVLSSNPFANNRAIEGEGAGLRSVQSVNIQDILSIDIMSRGPDARDRKEEILMAFNSAYAEQQQASNSFYIASISSRFINLSEIDGAAIPYRFNISIAIQYSITKIKAIPYYDTFQAVDLVVVEP